MPARKFVSSSCHSAVGSTSITNRSIVLQLVLQGWSRIERTIFFAQAQSVNDIWAYTKRAKILLADLTGKNPNVFYELGIAHALAKPVILIAENIDDIPFDLRALRIIIYDKDDPQWGSKLKEKIENSIREILASPLEAVLPAFLDIKSAGSKPSVSPEQKDLIEIKQELELMRREFRSLELGRSGERIDSESATIMIRDMVRRGAPQHVIFERLVTLGAPSVWVRRQIDRQIDRTKGEAEPDMVAVAVPDTKNETS